jgi:hypothetical protein
MSERITYELLGGTVYTGISPTKILIAEQQVSDTNPLFELANITNTSQHVQ